MASEGGRWHAVSQLQFFPLARAFLVAFGLALALVVVAVELRLVEFAYERIGIAPRYVLALLVLSLLGSAVNIPLAVLRGEPVVTEALVVVHGVPYVVPAARRAGGIVVAVNPGGAVIPILLSSFLLAHGVEALRAGLATALVAFVVHRLARPVQGLGIVVPIWIPPLVAAGAGLALGGVAPAGTAYVAGTLGTLIGADLLNLRRLRDVGAPVVSIGGAGTFDGIFVTGILAVLLA